MNAGTQERELHSEEARADGNRWRMSRRACVAPSDDNRRGVVEVAL